MPGERILSAAVVLLSLGATCPVQAYDVNEWLSVGGVVAVTGQCQLLADDAGAGDACRGAAPFQPELSLRPTGSDELFVRLGFAAGDALNPVSPFALAPWVADLQADVKDINGRYQHLLNAWYAHTFELPDRFTLRLTGGIIDATDYLDDNVYSNDEYTQFMNQALVNGPKGFLPSYDLGGAVELETGPWTARGVVMDVGENDDGNRFTFWGAQLGYRAETRWGEGNYRFLAEGGSRDFLDPAGVAEQLRLFIGLSFDQQLGETFGAWLRFGWQDESALVNFGAVYSGGLNIRGAPWGRPNDEIGLGYGHLPGGNGEVRSTHVAELYYRLAVSEQFALTADVQYLKDDVRSNANPGGLVLGLRGTFEF